MLQPVALFDLHLECDACRPSSRFGRDTEDEIASLRLSP